MRLYDFGKRMKQFRLQRKLTQAQMGKLLNLHYIHIGRYEKGKAVPTVDTLAFISQKLNVSIDYLVFGDRAQTHLGDAELLYLFKQILTLNPEARIDAKKMLGDFISEQKNPDNEA